MTYLTSPMASAGHIPSLGTQITQAILSIIGIIPRGTGRTILPCIPNVTKTGAGPRSGATAIAQPMARAHFPRTGIECRTDRTTVAIVANLASIARILPVPPRVTFAMALDTYPVPETVIEADASGVHGKVREGDAVLPERRLVDFGDVDFEVVVADVVESRNVGVPGLWLCELVGCDE